MRRLIPLAGVLLLLAAPARAQVDAQAVAAAAPPAATPAGTSVQHSHRQTLQQRFDAANTTHDGHLTKDQAAAADWPYVVNNFAAMDKGRKGYVTVADIHDFAHARFAANHRGAAQPQTLQQRFDAANTTHDGHLTRAQAEAVHWGYVAGNFAAIDKGGMGYVTIADIHAFAHARYAAHRKTLQQRFDAANTTHDGHLTKVQAEAAHWGYVAGNFAAIDKGGKGYVTVADIHAFSHARYVARHHGATHRETLQHRFDAANTTHDGHLTKAQAEAAQWNYVVHDFSAIDKGGKGYVTVGEIHAFAHARYLARHKAKVPPHAAAPAPAAETPAPAAPAN